MIDFNQGHIVHNSKKKDGWMDGCMDGCASFPKSLFGD